MRPSDALLELNTRGQLSVTEFTMVDTQLSPLALCAHVMMSNSPFKIMKCTVLLKESGGHIWMSYLLMVNLR